MALGTKPVEGATHIELLLGLHIEQCQVEGGATRMTTLQTDVVLRKEHALVKVGIEVGLHQRVGDVLGPAHEVVNALLRTIGIVDLQAIALCFDVIAHGFQTVSSLTGEQRCRFFITVDTSSHKIVRAEVTDFQNHIRYHVGNGYKLAGIVSRTDCRTLLRVRKTRHHRHAADKNGG